MRHCDKCEVDIADDITNCPLCGRDVSNNQSETKLLCYPNNKVWKHKRNFVMNFLLWIVIIGTVLTISVELIIFHKLHFSYYVLTGAILAIFDIILPIKKRWCFSAVNAVVGVSICLYLIFLELFTHTFGWGLNYAEPFFILFMSLYSTIIIFARNYYKGFEFIVPLIIFLIISTIVFIVNISMHFVLWPSLVAFLTSITCFVFVLIFKFKRVKQELQKSFFI